MSVRPVVLLDMDGPLADFDGEFWRRCKESGWAFDIEHPHEQRHRFFTEHIPNRVTRRIARTMVDSSPWFENLPVTAGAVDGVGSLMEVADVWVCTKPLEVNPTCRDAKGAWLRRHFPDLERRLIITPDKALIRGDILLDDAPHPAWRQRATWLPVIFDAPYNGPSSVWDGWPRWTWGQPVADLLAPMMGTAR